MAEIEEYVKIYIDKEILPEVTKKMERDIKPNAQRIIGPGKVGYDTGHLHDTIYSKSSVHSHYGVVTVGYIAEYGKYINEDGTSNHWKGIHFLEKGAEKTIELYK